MQSVQLTYASVFYTELTYYQVLVQTTTLSSPGTPFEFPFSMFFFFLLKSKKSTGNKEACENIECFLCPQEKTAFFHLEMMPILEGVGKLCLDKLIAICIKHIAFGYKRIQRKDRVANATSIPIFFKIYLSVLSC